MEFGERKWNSSCTENCKKCDFQELFWKIEKLLSLSVSDSELSIELFESVSELKSVKSCRTFTSFRFWSFTLWIWHFDGNICNFLGPNFDRTIHNQRKVFNVYLNWEFYFGKGGHKSAKPCEICYFHIPRFMRL